MRSGGPPRVPVAGDAPVIIEVKTVVNLNEDNRNQLCNYVHLAGHAFGVLLNFKTRGERVEAEAVFA